VEPKTTECFYEEINAGANVELSWAVLDGGLLDIRVIVSICSYVSKFFTYSSARLIQNFLSLVFYFFLNFIGGLRFVYCL
jgi:hypothetical protein